MKQEASTGVPKSVIARRYGVSRQTVHNILKPRVEQRVPRASKLDPLKDYIKARLEDFDLPATVLLQEIQAQGYSGGITILKEFARKEKGERVKEVIERFETLPAQQIQIDWGECGTILVNGR